MRVAVPLFLALVLYAQGAAAQFTGAPPSPDVHIDTVTVEAQKIPPSHTIHNFVKTYATPTPPFGKMARWGKDAPICPLATGLDTAFNVFVSERIRAVASLVGAPVQVNVPCKTNMMVWFTPHPQDVLDGVAATQPILLGFHDLSQTKALSTANHPIQAWYNTRTWRAEASPIPQIPTLTPISDEEKSEISTVVVVVDSAKIVGMPVGAVADYIAMLALSETQAFETCQPLPSITNLMTIGCEAQQSQGLTEMDVAYLKSLYNINANFIGSLQEIEIAHGMEAALREH